MAPVPGAPMVEPIKAPPPAPSAPPAKVPVSRGVSPGPTHPLRAIATAAAPTIAAIVFFSRKPPVRPERHILVIIRSPETALRPPIISTLDSGYSFTARRARPADRWREPAGSETCERKQIRPP